ncbi:putative RNA polymerase II transcription factor B subunit 1-1 [Artemisia annua]|uniref:Putative RNA polymerase II transcription factor B subunit 1-1 n=1 Tax=Artemisia annua TaxID=35608 RepID=A0A2U1NUG4_ARTAN|nr:putative RNA polymerase II transcription factor B subunit 1-1 [Artemisia annua]
MVEVNVRRVTVEMVKFFGRVTAGQDIVGLLFCFYSGLKETLRTAAAVLGSSRCGECSLLKGTTRLTEIEDVQAPHELPVAPLCIKDPRDYYDSQQVNATKQEAGMKQIGNLMQRMICRGLEAWTKGLTNATHSLSSCSYTFAYKGVMVAA